MAKLPVTRQFPHFQYHSSQNLRISPYFIRGENPKQVILIWVSSGNVEKSHQQRSRHFVVLTYWKYAPRVKIAAALLDGFFDHSRRILVLKSSRVYTGFFARNIQQALNIIMILLTAKREMHVIHGLRWKLEHGLNPFGIVS